MELFLINFEMIFFFLDPYGLHDIFTIYPPPPPLPPPSPDFIKIGGLKFLDLMRSFLRWLLFPFF
jgi:hypothetical protein